MRPPENGKGEVDEFAGLTINYDDVRTVDLRHVLSEKVRGYRDRWPTIPSDSAELRKAAVEAIAIIVMMGELLDRQAKAEQRMVKIVEQMVTVLQGDLE